MYSVLAFGMTFYSRSTLSHPFSLLCSLPARLSGYEPDNEDYEEFEAFMEHIGEDPKEQVQYMCMSLLPTLNTQHTVGLIGVENCVNLF